MLVVLSIVVGVVLVGSAPVTVTDEDVNRCYTNLVNKLRTLNGEFITQDQGVQMANTAFDMYLVENKTLEQIADYFKTNVNNLGFTPEQTGMFTDVYSKVVSILGSEEATTQLYKKALKTTFDFIANDKAKTDEMIGQLREQGASINTIKQRSCQQIFTLTTLEKKKEMTIQIAANIPEQSREAVKKEFSKIMKI
uniref:Uncharacterized protein n=1 Tax=Ditylenchus dipsaci TaxID=166011 RepID=A0A915CTU4_9BILA